MALTDRQLKLIAAMKANGALVVPVVPVISTVVSPSIPSSSIPSSSSSGINLHGFAVKEAIANLSNLILESHPTLPVLLRTIHTQLNSDPELVTLLSEDEIGIIVKGLSKQTNTVINAIAAKPKSKTKITLEMLG